jgi:GT2 family glycosyltransferase
MQTLVETVRAVAVQLQPPGLIRVHANSASIDETAQLREALNPLRGPSELEVTSSLDNLGFSRAHNIAMTEMFDRGYDGVLVLNPDLVLDRAALEALGAAEAAADQPALFGPLLELADPLTLAGTGLIDTAGIVWIFGGRHVDALQGRPLAEAPTEPIPVAGISGACLYVGRRAHATVIAAGPPEFFDEDFIAYREDAELAYRANLLGVHSWLIPQARGRHVRRLRGTRRGDDAAIDRLGVRNRFLIAFKYGRARPGGMPAGLARDAMVVAGVLLVERESLTGLREAWALRKKMRAKGRSLRLLARNRE